MVPSCVASFADIRASTQHRTLFACVITIFQNFLIFFTLTINRTEKCRLATHPGRKFDFLFFFQATKDDYVYRDNLYAKISATKMMQALYLHPIRGSFSCSGLCAGLVPNILPEVRNRIVGVPDFLGTSPAQISGTPANPAGDWLSVLFVPMFLSYTSI